MAFWTGIGLNYGHQSVYDTAQVEADLTAIKAAGVTRLRIAFPTYNGSVANCQDMVARALAHGFYVVWGVATGAGVGALTATVWAAYKAYVSGTLASWAQSNGLPELCIGNECDYQADGSTLTATTVRADVRALCASVKAGGYTGKVSYNTTILGTYRTPWISEGIGTLDLIGWNSYDTLSNFAARNPVAVSAFGNKAYISEFGCINSGFADYNDEALWYTDVVNRIGQMQAANVQSGYFFCYRDGGFGVPPNSFGVVKTDNSFRMARSAVLASAAPVYGGFMAHV